MRGDEATVGAMARLGARTSGVLVLLTLLALLSTLGGARPPVARAQPVPAASSPEQAIVALKALVLRGVPLPDGLTVTSAIPTGPLFLAFTDELIIGMNGGTPPSFDDLVARYERHGVLAFLHQNVGDPAGQGDDGTLVAFALDSSADAQALVQGGAPLGDTATDFPTIPATATVASLGDGGAVFAPGSDGADSGEIEAVWSRGSIAFDLTLQPQDRNVSVAHALSLAQQYDTLLAALPPAANLAAPVHPPPTSSERAQAYDRAEALDHQIGASAGWGAPAEAPFDPAVAVAAAPDLQAELSWIDDQAQIVGGATSSSRPDHRFDDRVLGRQILYTASAASATSALCSDPALPANRQQLPAPPLGDVSCAFTASESNGSDVEHLLEMSWTRGNALFKVALFDPNAVPELASVTAIATAFDASYQNAARAAEDPAPASGHQ